MYSLTMALMFFSSLTSIFHPPCFDKWCIWWHCFPFSNRDVLHQSHAWYILRTLLWLLLIIIVWTNRCLKIPDKQKKVLVASSDSAHSYHYMIQLIFHAHRVVSLSLVYQTLYQLDITCRTDVLTNWSIKWWSQNQHLFQVRHLHK